MAGEAGEAVARARALAVLRIRGAALGLALLPAAAAVVLHVGGATGRLGDRAGTALRWGVTGGALVVLAVAAAVAAVIVRARPAVSPTVPVAGASAPDLYRMVRDLADRLQVPAPSAIELTPDCDSWLEDRTAGAGETRRGTGRGRPRRRPGAPVLVIGSPFLWWMRVAELRALLAPVVAGTAPAADPEISAARRFVRGLDAAGGGRRRRGRAVLAAAARTPSSAGSPGCCCAAAGRMPPRWSAGWPRPRSERAQAVDYGLRIVAQEQVGLAYAGWDRLLTRVALPAWRMGRWPSRLDAGRGGRAHRAVPARPAGRGLRDPAGRAARVRPAGGARHGRRGGVAARRAALPRRPGAAGARLAAGELGGYPEEVVDRIWRGEAARLIRVLDELGRLGRGGPSGARPGHRRRPPTTRRGAAAGRRAAARRPARPADRASGRRACARSRAAPPSPG